MRKLIRGLICFLSLIGVTPAQVTQPDVSVLKEVRESAFGFLTTSDYQSMERYLPDGLNARLRDVEPEVLDGYFAAVARRTFARIGDVSAVEPLTEPHPGLRIRSASNSWMDFEVEDEKVTGATAQLDISVKYFRDGVEVGDSPFASRLALGMVLENGFWKVRRIVVTSPVDLFDERAINSLGRSVMLRNEATAVGSIRWINSAELDFAGQNSKHKFTCEIGRLAAASSENVPEDELSGLRTTVLKDGVRSGYRFAFGGCSPFGARYQVSAEPIRPGKSGGHSYCSDESGVIYISSSAAAVKLA